MMTISSYLKIQDTEEVRRDIILKVMSYARWNRCTDCVLATSVC